MLWMLLAVMVGAWCAGDDALPALVLGLVVVALVLGGPRG